MQNILTGIAASGRPTSLVLAANRASAVSTDFSDALGVAERELPRADRKRPVPDILAATASPSNSDTKLASDPAVLERSKPTVGALLDGLNIDGPPRSAPIPNGSAPAATAGDNATLQVASGQALGLPVAASQAPIDPVATQVTDEYAGRSSPRLRGAGTGDAATPAINNVPDPVAPIGPRPPAAAGRSKDTTPAVAVSVDQSVVSADETAEPLVAVVPHRAAGATPAVSVSARDAPASPREGDGSASSVSNMSAKGSSSRTAGDGGTTVNQVPSIPMFALAPLATDLPATPNAIGERQQGSAPVADFAFRPSKPPPPVDGRLAGPTEQEAMIQPGNPPHQPAPSASVQSVTSPTPLRDGGVVSASDAAQNEDAVPAPMTSTDAAQPLPNPDTVSPTVQQISVATGALVASSPPAAVIPTIGTLSARTLVVSEALERATGGRIDGITLSKSITRDVSIEPPVGAIDSADGAKQTPIALVTTTGNHLADIGPIGVTAAQAAVTQPPRSERATESESLPTHPQAAHFSEIAVAQTDMRMAPVSTATSPLSHPADEAPVRSVADQITPSIVAMVRDHGAARQLSISITPDQLGQVSITVGRAADGTTSIHVAAEQLATLDLLRKDQSVLMQALDQSGTGQSSHTLTFSWNGGDGGMPDWGNRGWSGPRDPPPLASAVGSYAEEPTNPPNYTATGRGGIDVIA